MTKYEKIKNMIFDEIDENTLRQSYIIECQNLSEGLKLSTEVAAKIFDSNELENIGDYKLITPEEMKIETIRDIIAKVKVMPYKKRKIYVFQDASKMTKPMQNALLKTIEEPPSYALFIFIIQNANILLETLRSRCMKYYLEEDVKDIYEREDLTLKVRQLYEILISKDREKLLSFLDELYEMKDDIDDFITIFLESSRNIILAKESSNLLPDEHKQNKYIHDIINKFTYYELLTIIDLAEETRKKLNSNCSYKLTCETMLFNMMEVSINK